MQIFDITDELLNNSKVNAYSCNCMITDTNGKKIPYNPKKVPTKAIDIIFHPGDLLCEIFLDTELKKWDSRCFDNDKKSRLSPELMAQFFRTNFYSKLISKISDNWPLTDNFHKALFRGAASNAIVNGRELKKADIQSINLKNLADEISEDMVAPAGVADAPAADVQATTDSGLLSTSDVLNKTDDTAKDGYMGKNNFNIPFNVFGSVKKRKKKRS